MTSKNIALFVAAQERIEQEKLDAETAVIEVRDITTDSGFLKIEFSEYLPVV